MYGCVGAVDGIHLRIIKPKKDGATYVCCKGFFSINCQAIVDAQRRFLFVEAGAHSPSHDSTAFRDSAFFHALEEGCLPDRFYIYGDDAYKACHHQVVTPYPGKDLHHTAPDKDAANYYISHSCIEVECAFGELVRRWWILWRPLICDVGRAAKVIVVLCKLHNLCKSKIHMSTAWSAAAGDDDGGGRSSPFYTDLFPYDPEVFAQRQAVAWAAWNVGAERQTDRCDAIKNRLWSQNPAMRMHRPKHSRPRAGYA